MVTASGIVAGVVRYGCVLCGRRFQLAGARPALPAHAYPSGLFRGRPCPSVFGVRA
jgi:hypothetical protein